MKQSRPSSLIRLVLFSELVSVPATGRSQNGFVLMRFLLLRKPKLFLHSKSIELVLLLFFLSYRRCETRTSNCTFVEFSNTFCHAAVAKSIVM
jgi:hypothetical protein